MDKINEEITVLKNKLQTLTKQIAEKSGGKDEFFRERDLIKGQIDEVQRQLTELDTGKQKLNDQIKNKLQEGRDMLQEINTMKKKIGFQSEEEIDKEISEIEFQMHTETLSLKREKELMAKISQLKQVKPQLSKFKSLKQGTGTSDTVGPLRGDLSEIQRKTADLREEKRKLQAQYTKIVEARKKSMGGVSHLFDEKTELSEQIKAKIDEVKAIREEKNVKMREFSDFIKVQKESRAERDKAEKIARDAENEKKRLETELAKDSELPFLAEIELCENTIKYCQSFLPSTDKVEEKKAPEVKAINGTTFVQGKEREVHVSGGKSKGKPSGSSANKINKITHTLDTIGLFVQLKVEAPTGVKDIPSTVESLKTKLEEFKKKQVKEIADRKNKRGERELAFEAAAKAAEHARVEADKVAGDH